MRLLGGHTMCFADLMVQRQGRQRTARWFSSVSLTVNQNTAHPTSRQARSETMVSKAIQRPVNRVSITTGLLSLAFAAGALALTPGHAPAADGPSSDPRWAGEFERTERLLMTWHRDNWEYLEAFEDVVMGAADAKVPVTMLVANANQERRLLRAFDAHAVPHEHVVFERVATDSMWMRDYGPMVVTSPTGEAALVDLPYGDDRPLDDRVPEKLARLWELPLLRSDLKMEGGHILSDGIGHCVVTDDLIARNLSEGVDWHDIRDHLHALLGCRAVITVPALLEEPTGHVDLFVSIPGPRRALVGRYRRSEDPENAQRLDETAEILRDAGFSVERIPMPSNGSRYLFRSYTNLLALNEVVLMPVYEQDPRFEGQAVAAVRKAYPGRRIRRVPADSLIELAGAIHCTAVTLPASLGPGRQAAFAGHAARVARLKGTRAWSRPRARRGLDVQGPPVWELRVKRALSTPYGTGHRAG